MTYGHQIALNPSVTQNLMGVAQSYRLNSLYDPELTGGGSQPYGFDTMATIYQRYKVRSVIIDAELVSVSNGDETGFVSVLVPSNTTLPTLAGASTDSFIDKPFTIITLMNSRDSPSGKYHYRQVVDVARLDGLTALQFDADVSNYSAAVTADPTNTPRLTCAVANISTTTQFACTLKITLTFDVEFWDRTILAQSVQSFDSFSNQASRSRLETTLNLSNNPPPTSEDYKAASSSTCNCCGKR